MKEDYQSIKIIGLQSCIDILEERFAVTSGPNFLLISSTKNSTFKPPKLYAVIYAINMLNKMRSIVVDNLTHLCRYVHLRIFQISFLRWEKKWRKKIWRKRHHYQKPDYQQVFSVPEELTSITVGYYYHPGGYY